MKTIYPVTEIYSIADQVGPSSMATSLKNDVLSGSKPKPRCAIQLLFIYLFNFAKNT